MKSFSRTLIAVAVAATSSHTFAAAFQLNEHSATGLGRAFAGEAAVADNAAVVARNPAAMTRFEKSEISVATTYIDPGVQMTGVDSPYPQVPASALDVDSAAPTAVIPAAYVVLPFKERYAIGMGVFTNFGLSTDFDEQHPAGQIAGKTELKTINFNLSLAYQLDDQWSLGLGLNAIRGDAELNRHVGTNVVGLPATMTATHLSGDGWGFGYNVGLQYELTEQHRFALTYRSATDITLEGNYSNQLPPALGGLGGSSVPGELELNLPDMAEFAGFHQLNQQLALHYSLSWTGWSRFKELKATASADGTELFSKTENFEDSWRIGLGATYQLSPQWLVRAGAAYDQSPIQTEYRSLSIPDSDRVWYSVGASYAISTDLSIDMAVSYIDGQKVLVQERDEFGQLWQVDSEGNALLAALQLNYAF